MGNQFVAWTDAERELLRKLVADAETGTTHRIKSRDFKKIATLFPNRTKNSLYLEIYRQRNVGKLVRREYKPWADEEILRLKVLYSGEKWRLNLGREFPGREARDVLEKARRLGLSRRILKTEAKQLTDMQRGILAGLIMGDGCLNHRIAGQGRKQHLNTIEFSNTDPGLVELFASMVTNCNVSSYLPKLGGFRKERKPFYAARVCAREAVRNVLLQILPCLAGWKLIEAREMMLCLEGGHKE